MSNKHRAELAVFLLQSWQEKTGIMFQYTLSIVFLPLSPPGWRGIVVTVRAAGRAGGRSGGRLPDLRNPYLCNRWMDFLRSKFYGIV